MLRLVYVLMLLPLLTALIGRQRADGADSSLPTTEQFNAALSTCAAGLDVSINADLLGSVGTIYSGQRTNGAASFKTATKFLELFPEADRTKAYELYTKCIAHLIAPGGGPTSSSSKYPGTAIENLDIQYGTCRNNDCVACTELAGKIRCATMNDMYCQQCQIAIHELVDVCRVNYACRDGQVTGLARLQLCDPVEARRTAALDKAHMNCEVATLVLTARQCLTNRDLSDLLSVRSLR
jgi:hypothetical protein